MNNTELAFYGFMAFLLLTFWKKNTTNKAFTTLDFNSSEQLKGIAIILVVFGHLCSGFINLPTLKYFGAQGVSIFLILSGFGLTKSYLKNGVDGTFFVKRFKTVLLPYMIVTGVVILLDHLTNKNTIPKSVILSSLFGLNMQVDPTMWYISFIFLWYSVFYIVFGLKVSNPFKIVFLLIFSCVIKYNVLSGSSLLNTPYEYSLHAFAFPIGVIAALYSKKFISIFKKKNLQLSFLSIVAVTLFAGFLFSFRNISIEHQTIYTVINLMLAISLILIIVLLNYLQVESKFLALLGKYSYEIYLFEALFFTRYNALIKFSNKWGSLLFYIFVVLLFSFILNKLMKISLTQVDKIRLKRNIQAEHFSPDA